MKAPVNIEIQARLARLGSLSRVALIEAWTGCYGSPPPSRTSQKLMLKAIAYRWQQESIGGLSAHARKALRMVAQGKTARPARPLGITTRIKPGTRFVREWHGRLIEVVVADDGRFNWEGKSYASLSVIARKVTNTRRNGPAFFGLREG